MTCFRSPSGNAKTGDSSAPKTVEGALWKREGIRRSTRARRRISKGFRATCSSDPVGEGAPNTTRVETKANESHTGAVLRRVTPEHESARVSLARTGETPRWKEGVRKPRKVERASRSSSYVTSGRPEVVGEEVGESRTIPSRRVYEP